MLLPYKSYYYRHSKHYHLGDLINIVQQVHHRALHKPGLHFISGLGLCPCCGVDSIRMIKDVLSLLDTPVRYGEGKNIIRVSPSWSHGHKSTPYDWKYAKAKTLPRRGNHVVCQFDKRSRGDKCPRVIDFIKPEMINIGDRKRRCVNKTELDLLAKFRILASAKEYIGIDSGMTHLALMTETPITVIHPKSWNARQFYPPSSQLRFLEV